MMTYWLIVERAGVETAVEEDLNEIYAASDELDRRCAALGLPLLSDFVSAAELWADWEEDEEDEDDEEEDDEEEDDEEEDDEEEGVEDDEAADANWQPAAALLALLPPLLETLGPGEEALRLELLALQRQLQTAAADGARVQLRLLD